MPYGAGDLAKGLSIWVSLSGGAFPDDLRDLGDSTRVRPLLVAKYNKGGVPATSCAAAISDAAELEQAFEQAQHGEKEGNLHYVGEESPAGTQQERLLGQAEGAESGDLTPIRIGSCMPISIAFRP